MNPVNHGREKFISSSDFYVAASKSCTFLCILRGTEKLLSNTEKQVRNRDGNAQYQPTEPIFGITANSQQNPFLASPNYVVWAVQMPDHIYLSSVVCGIQKTSLFTYDLTRLSDANLSFVCLYIHHNLSFNFYVVCFRCPCHKNSFIN